MSSEFSPVFELIIGTPFDDASYIIESSAGVIGTGTVSSTISATVDVQSDFQVVSSEFADRMKGLTVRATGDNPISVLVTVTYPSFFRSAYATYLVHPNKEFENEESYEYFGLSTDYGEMIIPTRRSNILLIGNFDETTVSITPTQVVRLPNDAQADSPMVDVAAGATHEVTLGRLQSLLLLSLTDLTGTRIVSNKPLTVVTGHQCAQIPSTEVFCEPIYVQVPPTLNWGQTFLLAPFAGRNASQFYKLVTSKDSTTVAYRCDTLGSKGIEISTAGSGSILALPANSFCYLTASNPILVVQWGSGFATDNMGDPAMALVSPSTGHVSSTSFITLLFPNDFISVTVQAEHFDESQILLDGGELTCTWQDIYAITSEDIVGHGCTAGVTAGIHVISHSGENGVLSVIVCGWSARPSVGYAYLTGINLEVSEPDTGGMFLFCKDTDV